MGLLRDVSDLPLRPASTDSTVAVRLPPVLVSAFGPMLAIPADDNTTINDIKQALSELLGIDDGDLTLADVFGATLANGATLGDLGVSTPGGVLDLSLTDGLLPPAFAVVIALPPSLQALYGQTLSLATSEVATV